MSKILNKIGSVVSTIIINENTDLGLVLGVIYILTFFYNAGVKELFNIGGGK